MRKAGRIRENIGLKTMKFLQIELRAFFFVGISRKLRNDEIGRVDRLARVEKLYLSLNQNEIDSCASLASALTSVLAFGLALY